MPKLGFGAKARFDGGKQEYLELLSKGDEAHIRVLGAPVYDGKHFLRKADGSWDVPYCSRIMSGAQDCPYCQKYFDARKEIKTIKKEAADPENLTVEEKELVKRAEAISKKYGVAITFYYPVLDRTETRAILFKTGLSFRTFLDAEYEAGIKILDYDFKVKRIKGNIKDPGKDWYTFTRLDSQATEPLTDEEHEEISKVDAWDLESMIADTKKSTQAVETGTGNEDVSFDELNLEEEDTITSKDTPF